MALGFPQFGDSHQRGFHNKSSRTATGKGWGRHDFYGGEDAGDDSEGASDEDRTLKEAKKLEEWLVPRPLGISQDFGHEIWDDVARLSNI